MNQRNKAPLKLSDYYLLVVAVACLIESIWFGTGLFSNPDFDYADVYTSVPVRHKYTYAEEDIAISEVEQTVPKQTQTKPSGILLGNYPIDYYALFPLYEATAFQVNGDYDDDGKREVVGDGGFGPLQETHSGLANMVDRLYDSDKEFYSWLKPFSDNPLSYLKSCQGNDRFNHKWGICKSYGDGSLLLRSVFVEHIKMGTPEMKRFYEDYMREAESDYLEPAIADLEAITGKPIEEIGVGTVAALFAVYVRYGKSDKVFDGYTYTGEESDLIDHISDFAFSRGNSARFKCQRYVAKALNDKAIDIMGVYCCDGSCGSKHEVPHDRTFSCLFGE